MSEEISVISSITYSVRVHGWGSPRIVAIHEDRIYFQAAVCFPCPTCNSRVKQLNEGLKRSGLGQGNILWLLCVCNAHVSQLGCSCCIPSHHTISKSAVLCRL